ncbi:outer membrane protein assembly factor BamB family protein [Nocardia sp. NBC_01327]|uniref:outer membrane protein assembly factor BamB family protein n=1 Tax=Nocardia sp. NBC_01327 TaxID=2903593 RepID=UPI002E0F3923|nr:PQQ-like beta-propeller repeat protein [Nocardia sp. NBC_01327]
MVNGVEALRKWLSRIAAAAGALGAGLIVGGTALAVYSRCFASTRSLHKEWLDRGAWFTAGPGVEISVLPGYLATAALLTGIAMLVTVAVVVVRVVRRWDSYLGLNALVALSTIGAVVVLPFMAVHYHLLEAYRLISFEYQLFEMLPTAIAAAGVLVAGTVLFVPIALRPVHTRTLPIQVLALLLTTGMLVSAGVAVAAVRLGDDQRNIDHTTASRTESAAVPDRLGAERYRIPIPVAPNYFGETAADDVVPAGAGFVIASAQGLTAYDGSTGLPRWHYLRRNVERDGRFGPAYIPRTLRPLDNGAMVLALWDQLGWIAFDASTGEILWQGSDFTRDTVPGVSWEFPGSELRTDSEALILVGDNRITGYDSRSGLRLWSADTTTPECKPSKSDVAATETVVYQISRCTNHSEFWFTSTVRDARTGVVIGTREVGRSAETNAPESVASIKRFGGVVVIWWLEMNDTHHIVFAMPQQLATTPVTDEKDYLPIGGDQAGTEALVDKSTHTDDGYNHDRLPVLELPEGAEKYTLTGPEPDHDSPLLFLPAEIVAVFRYGSTEGNPRSSLQSWSRDNGGPAADRPIASDNRTCDFTQLMAAPGATLALCVEDQSAELVGFGSVR